MTSHTGGAATALVLLLALGGCGNGSPGPVAEPPLDPEVMAMEPTQVAPSGTSYPLDPYLADNTLTHVVERATAIVQQECYRRFGLDLPLAEPPDAPPFPPWDRYGIWDGPVAAEFGYSSPPQGEGLPFAHYVVEAGTEWVPLIRGEVSTFNGVEVPEGGCEGEAFRAVGLDEFAGTENALRERLQEEARIRSREHTAVVALIDDWALCLRQAGWEFADPMEPFHRFQGGAVSDAEEFRAALADIECKKSTGLLRAWVAADVAYQRALVEEHSEALREVAGRLDELRRNADQVIAGER